MISPERTSNFHPPADLDLAVEAAPANAPVLRGALRDYLRSVDLSDDRASDVVLAVGEATSNAIEHAYVDGVGTVRLRGTLRRDRLVLEVCDGGRWRPDADLDCGRGLGIMRALVDRVAIESSRAGTSVRLEILLAS